MAQSQTQEQVQKQEQRQIQTVSQQQMLQSQLVELPITQFLERIETEMHDNPALESQTEDYSDLHAPDYAEGGTADDESGEPDDFDAQREREERSDAFDEALESLGRDDEELPVYRGGQGNGEEREEIVYGTTSSFYDYLLEQMHESRLTERQLTIMEYIIGSLDDDGLLRKDLAQLSDELAIYQSVDASTNEIGEVLKQLQTFDPPGIGARTLQECLLIQIARKGANPNADKLLIKQMHEVIAHYFDEFTKKHWHKIVQAMSLTDEQTEVLQHELRRLNPKPGASMGETLGRSMQQITPDFIVSTDDDGTITMHLNQAEAPELQVSQSFADLMKDYQQNRDSLTRQQKEALLYIKQKVDAAQSFIEAVKSRRRTLTLTMRAIIRLQHRFFEDGDEASLRPMILKDVAAATGLDISTVSRVSNSKYVETRWGIFPLRFFFSDSYVTESGEELSTREIKVALRDIIEGEDKRKPYSDEALAELLEQQGYPIARRTVAKYREQMGLPIARLRK